jgi:hypothetical protein
MFHRTSCALLRLLPPTWDRFDESGTDVMIFIIFAKKFGEKIGGVLTQNKAKLCKIFITT